MGVSTGRVGKHAYLVELDREDGGFHAGVQFATNDCSGGRCDRWMLSLLLGPYYLHLVRLANPGEIPHAPRLWTLQWTRGFSTTRCWGWYVSPDYYLGALGNPGALTPEEVERHYRHFSVGPQAFRTVRWKGRDGVVADYIGVHDLARQKVEELGEEGVREVRVFNHLTGEPTGEEAAWLR